MSDLRKHYQRLFAEHGDDSAAVQYADKASHYRRFEILSGIANPLGDLADLGCGLAHFYDFLLTRGFTGSYTGLDFVPEFIEHNRRKFANHPKAAFAQLDIVHQPIPGVYDYLVLSGVFNNQRDDNQNEAFMMDTIRKMFAACRKGIAFNAMSTYVDYFDPHLYYSDPLTVFDFCKRELSRKATLRHDYLVRDGSIPFEYTIYLYR